MNTLFALALIMGGDGSTQMKSVIGVFPSLQKCEQAARSQSSKAACFLLKNGDLIPTTEVLPAR
jgi:hypothetical protein